MPTEEQINKWIDSRHKKFPVVPQLEGPATKIYNYVPGGFGDIKQEKKKKFLLFNSEKRKLDFINLQIMKKKLIIIL